MVETLRVAPELDLLAPDGSTVRLHEVKARLERQGDRLVDVWLIGDLRPDDWERVDAGEWFHLSREVRGPTFAGGFEPEATLRLEARLESQHATALGLISEDEWELLAEIRFTRLLPVLRQTESWYGLHVTQERGPIRGGFRTRWADDASP